MIMKLGSLFQIPITTCVKRRLAETSRWRHIRLAIKPRYLGNQASQIKSYYGTISGNHGRSFRIRHLKVRAAHPVGWLMMTSYPAWNKTSSSRKRCILDKTLQWISTRKSWSESVMKKCVQRPLAKDWRWRHIQLAIKPQYLGNHASHIKSTMDHYLENMVALFRIRREKVRAALPHEGLTMT